MLRGQSARAALAAIMPATTGVKTMQKYRADVSERQNDGAIVWRTDWIGGPSLAKIENCRMNIAGEPRVTAYVTGEADTWFSIPAVCSYKGCRVRGYITGDDDGELMFRVVFY
jgi:hypothetical protein